MNTRLSHWGNGAFIHVNNPTIMLSLKIKDIQDLKYLFK